MATKVTCYQWRMSAGKSHKRDTMSTRTSLAVNILGSNGKSQKAFHTDRRPHIAQSSFTATSFKWRPPMAAGPSSLQCAPSHSCHLNSRAIPRKHLSGLLSLEYNHGRDPRAGYSPPVLTVFARNQSCELRFQTPFCRTQTLRGRRTLLVTRSNRNGSRRVAWHIEGERSTCVCRGEEARNGSERRWIKTETWSIWSQCYRSADLGTCQ